jgi:hypothetical protein
VDPAQRFDVTVEANPRGMSARLVVRGAGEATVAERSVEAASCDDLFDTLAFIVAMTIDPKTAERAAPDASTLSPEESPGAAPPPSPAVAAASPAPPPPAEGPTPGAKRAPNDRAPEPSPPSSEKLGFEIGANVEGTTAIAPGVTPAARLFGGLRVPSVGVVYPSFRVSASRSVEKDAAVDDERGGYLAVTAGRFDACASSGFGSSRFVVDLCPAAEVGVRSGEGYGVDPPKTPTSTWFSLDLLARFGFLAGDWALIQVEGGLVVPVTRDTFVLKGPDAEVFETPALALAFGGGMAVRLP